MSQRRAALRALVALVAMLSCWFGALVCAGLWAQADDELDCLQDGIYEGYGCQDPWYYGSTWRATFGLGTLGLAVLSIAFLFLVVNSDRARRAYTDR